MATATSPVIWKKRYPMDYASSPQDIDIDLQSAIHPLGSCEGFCFVVKATYVNYNNGSYNNAVTGQCLVRVNLGGTTTVGQSDFNPDRFGLTSSSVNITFGTDGSFTVLRISVLEDSTGALKGQLFVEITGGPDPTP